MRIQPNNIQDVMRCLFARWIPPAFVGAAGGGLAALAGLPAAWLIGPMAAGLVSSVGLRKAFRVPSSAFSAAQIVIGLTVGLSFSLETIQKLGSHFPAVLMVLILTTALSLGNGYLLSLWTGIDRSSGLLGCVPGAASAMVASADKVGADARTVAVLQYVRVLVILAVVPPAISAWAHHFQSESVWSELSRMDIESVFEASLATLPLPHAPTISPFLGIVLLAALGIVGSIVGMRMRFPSPFVLGPMVLTTAFATAFAPVVDAGLSVPTPIFNVALTVIGTSVGLRFSADILKELGRVILVEILLLMGLLLLSILLAYFLFRITGIDLVTAVLGNVPGALEAIVATAVDLEADAPIVAAMQTMRSFALLCLGPWIVRRLHHAESLEPAA